MTARSHVTFQVEESRRRLTSALHSNLDSIARFRPDVAVPRTSPSSRPRTTGLSAAGVGRSHSPGGACEPAANRATDQAAEEPRGRRARRARARSLSDSTGDELHADLATAPLEEGSRDSATGGRAVRRPGSGPGERARAMEAIVRHGSAGGKTWWIVTGIVSTAATSNGLSKRSAVCSLRSEFTGGGCHRRRKRPAWREGRVAAAIGECDRP